MPQSNDFLVRREDKNTEKAAPEAVFTFLGPVGTTQRFKFLVVREAGDLLSILPGAEKRFKTGFKALRWDQAEGGTSSTYIVTKTKSNRIDLRLLPT